MSTYVMGDIHGNYYAFKNMLKNIKFSQADTMYIIGDIVDRGPEPLKILKKVIKTPNIITLLGNHENMMARFYKTHDLYDKYLWYRNGGIITQEQFDKLPIEEKNAILSWMDKLPLKVEVNINNQKYVLAHACPYAKYKKDILWLRIYPYQTCPPGDEIYICGHTPVLKYSHEKNQTARILKSADRRMWFIDCGCAYGDDKRARLACVRLEDGKEFYCHTYPRNHY